MENQRVAAVRSDQPIFGPPAQAGNPRTRQSLTEILRDGSPKVGAARFDPGQPPALEHRLKAADRGFDFGELRHGGRMAKASQAR